jgi:NTP pyrophosphatase (non-canonical NTP hydrolase)
MMKNDRQPANGSASDCVSIQEFQKLIRDMYFSKDIARGVSGTFMWLMEEVGELSSALRETSSGDSDQLSADELNHRRENLQEEFADVLAWLATIANVVDVDLNEAVKKKYGSGCPGCQQFICVCPDEEKP